MKISFPYAGYEEIAPVEVPDTSLLGVYTPGTAGDINDQEVLSQGFAEPHGAVSLREAVNIDNEANAA